MTAILTEAAAFYRRQLAGSWVPRYLTNRGLASALRYRWGTGTAPTEWDALTSHLRGNGWSDTAIIDAGLATRTRHGTLIDRFRNRAILPIRDHADGAVIGFIGRSTQHQQPRWLNSPATIHYDKSTTLYGIHEAHATITNGATIAIVEGPFDAIAVTEAGRGTVAGIATCGTALTPQHAATIATIATGPVVVAFDADTAGTTAAAAAWRTLTNAGINATVATLSHGDAAETLHQTGPSNLVTELTTNNPPLVSAAIAAAIEPWQGHFNEPECRVAAMRATLPILAELDTTDAAHHSLLVARQLGIHPDALLDSDAWLGMLADALRRTT